MVAEQGVSPGLSFLSGGTVDLGEIYLYGSVPTWREWQCNQHVAIFTLLMQSVLVTMVVVGYSASLSCSRILSVIPCPCIIANSSCEMIVKS